MRYCINISLLLFLILIGRFSCEPKHRESVDISAIPMSRFNELQNLDYHDGPIVERKDDSYRVQYVKRDE